MGTKLPGRASFVPAMGERPGPSLLKAATNTLEVASEAEIPRIQQVADLSWRRAFAHILSPSEIDHYMATSFSAERLRARIAESDYFVAKDGADVVGFGAFGDRGNGPELLLLYVRRSHWRRGVGSTLLSGLEVGAKDRGIEEYVALVHRENEMGRAFYRKCGFEHRIERDQADHWGMVKSLGKTGAQGT